MNVLITGGAGFLGSHLAEALLQQGQEVVALDINDGSKVKHLLSYPSFRFIQGDVLDGKLIEGLVANSDLIYHMGAVVGVGNYLQNPYQVLQVNINGTQNVLEAALKYKVKVIFTSTSEIYGRNAKVPFSEDDDRVLGATSIKRWCYSTSKAAAEHFCFAFYEKGVPVVVLRYFNIYGPRLDKVDEGRVLAIFIGQALRNLPITLVNSGEQTRCFTYVADAIEATVTAGLKEEAVGKAFNIGTETETTIKELAELVVKVTGTSSTIVSVPQEAIYGSSYEDIPRRVPNLRRMHEILGVRAITPLEEGLKPTIDWFKSEGLT